MIPSAARSRRVGREGRAAARRRPRRGARGPRARQRPRGAARGLPAASRPMSPPRSRRRPDAGAHAAASWLTQRAWWSWLHSATGRPGATPSRSSAVGHPAERSTDQPWPSIQPAGVTRPLRAAAAPPRSRSRIARRSGAPSRSSAVAARAALPRWRCASVMPGRTHRSVRQAPHAGCAGPARPIRSARPSPAGDTRPAADRDASDPAEPAGRPRASRCVP